jgi:hypothetical protein
MVELLERQQMVQVLGQILVLVLLLLLTQAAAAAAV